MPTIRVPLSMPAIASPPNCWCSIMRSSLPHPLGPPHNHVAWFLSGELTVSGPPFSKARASAYAVPLNPDGRTSSYHPYFAALPGQLLQHTYSVLAIPGDAQAKTRVLPMHHNFVLKLSLCIDCLAPLCSWLGEAYLVFGTWAPVALRLLFAPIAFQHLSSHHEPKAPCQTNPPATPFTAPSA